MSDQNVPQDNAVEPVVVEPVVVEPVVVEPVVVEPVAEPVAEPAAEPVAEHVVEPEANIPWYRRPWARWTAIGIGGLLGLLLVIWLIILLISGIRNSVGNLNNGNDGVTTNEPVVVPTVRIPGQGSQLDHSGGMPFARVNVHDNEPANSAGYFDRTIINSDDPSDIGMGDDFSVPEGWTVERDFSLVTNQFVDYMTVKPSVSDTAEAIRNWAAENGLKEGISYEITSVIVIDGQECSVRGVDANRVRINVYVGENWSFQTCPAK